MAGVFQEFFHVDGGVAERRIRFLARQIDRVEQRGFRVHDPHAAPATASSGLDDDGIAERARDLDDLARLFAQHAVRPGHGRYSGRDHRLLGRHLVAHRANRFRSRTDKAEAAFFDPLRKVCVFRQESVAGMNRLRVGDFGGADDCRNVQIAVFRRRGPYADRFIGELDVLCIRIGFRMHDHRADAHLTASALHPQCDLTAIGDQNLFKHGRSEARGAAPRNVSRRSYSMMNSGWPYSTGCPFSTRISLTLPPTSASISFSNFIASMMHSVSPGFTTWPSSMNDAAPGLGER